MKQDVRDLYAQIVELTMNFMRKEEEKDINVDDLLSVSSTLVCFAVDLLRSNTDAEDEDIQLHLEEAIDVALLPQDELDDLANQEDDYDDEDGDDTYQSVIPDPAKIDKKLLN